MSISPLWFDRLLKCSQLSSPSQTDVIADTKVSNLENVKAPNDIYMEALSYLQDSMFNLSNTLIKGYDLMSVDDVLLEMALFEHL